jgi:acetyl-CoA acetyltransferase
MALAEIPWGCWWSTPFARWQGPLADLHALELAAHAGRRALGIRGVPVDMLDSGVLGTTVPQKGAFYGLPWVAGMLGASHLAGPTISQACATSARCVAFAAAEVVAGHANAVLVITADRVSNGPLLAYPRPGAPGGSAETETWVLDNFARDPFAGVAMIQTAENVARKHGISREAQDDVTLMRSQAYWEARDRGFHARFMDLPFEVPGPGSRKVAATLDGDTGVQPTNAEKVRKLSPVLDGGTVTFAGQTHPADGNAGLVVTDAARATELRRGKQRVRLLGFGQARVSPAFMPEAPIPAARAALAAAELDIGGIDLVSSHNPFALNDLVFAMETGFPLAQMNVNGCSLVWGHPQGPTGLRAIIELVEALGERGGGRGLFQGCAAGDSAMAVAVEVSDG